MDKRVIMIIAILIVGLSCMYFIVGNSTTVGNAITTFSKSSVTLPYGFSVEETNAESAELHNKQTDERINIDDHGKGDHVKENFDNLTRNYNSNPDYSDVKDTSKKINDIEVKQLTMQTNDTITSCSVFYHYNRTYIVEMIGFEDIDKMNDDLEFIIKTLQPDYKQAQD